MPIIKMRSKVLAMSIGLLEAVDLALNSRLLTFKASLYFPYQDPLFSAMERLIKKKYIYFLFQCTSAPTFGASLVAQMVKNPPTMQENQVQSLDQEDPLEKGMAIHSRTPWTEEPGGPQSMGSQRVGHDK